MKPLPNPTGARWIPYAMVAVSALCAVSFMAYGDAVSSALWGWVAGVWSVPQRSAPRG